MDKIKKKIFEYVPYILAAIVIYLLLTNLVFIRGQVKGGSMKGTYEDGSQVLSFYYDKNNIERFDTVVFDLNKEKTLIKRVIGLPNEKIEYKDNKLYINGQYIEELFLKENTKTEDFEYTLKDNEYYCMGDNRGSSRDSRAFGPVTKDMIKATHLFVFYPFDKIGFYE